MFYQLGMQKKTQNILVRQTFTVTTYNAKYLQKKTVRDLGKNFEWKNQRRQPVETAYT